MTRRKRGSKMLERAERRYASLRSLGTVLDLGNGLTLDAFNAQIATVRERLIHYNTALSTIDKAYNDVLSAEQQLGAFAESMLLGVAVRYGKNSDEYEMAGGVRRPERRRRKPKAAVNPLVEVPSGEQEPSDIVA